MPPDVEHAAAPRPPALLEQVRAVLARSPSALLTDLDGTISPIAPTADLASVPDAARRVLATLAQRLALVGVVSGRSVADARQLLGLDELLYIGNHGAERWEAGRAVLAPAAAALTQQLGRVLEAARRLLPLEGLLFENKGATGAIHYRLAADPVAARQAILETLARLPEASNLTISEGRLVVNLLPPSAPTKGDAVAELVRERGLRGVVYLGDDRTDLDAFRALRQLRSAGQCATLSIGVLSQEAPAEMTTLADAMLPDVDAVVQLLGALAAV